MSGATSIPLAFIALFSDGTHQKEFFAILAYVALLVLVFGIGRKNVSLQAQLDDRAKRKETEGKLGDYHMKLTDRVRIIKAMWYYEYANKYEASYRRTVFDPDTQALLDEIEAFLTLNIKGASVAKFRDLAGLKLTPVEGPSDSSGLMFKHQHWQAVIDNLNCRAIQLMEIIDKYSENKAKLSDKSSF
jgi:hypothetical protein